MSDETVDCDLLSPQIREMYTALMQAGHLTEAANLVRERTATTDGGYLDTKRNTVYNMWIYNVARAFEDRICNKGAVPCNLCLDQARKIGGELWLKISKFL